MRRVLVTVLIAPVVWIVAGCAGFRTQADPIDLTLIMVTVPSGSFQRDLNPANLSVITEPFRISAHEITRAQFSAVMLMDPSVSDFSSGLMDPVQSTNWYHAIAFCNKLSIHEGLSPVYNVQGVDFATLTYSRIPASSNAAWDAATADWNANGYRLPTEMEWMWAAMGAENTPDKPFAGATGRSEIGDYAGVDSGSQRVIRGGAWSASNSSGGEVARRSWNNPESSTADTGFRVVLRLQ